MGKRVGAQSYRNGILEPTFRVQKGSTVNIAFQNKMAEHSNAHWHGLVVSANMDGHPERMIMPNENFNFQFPINQQAGISWYYPHIHKLTGKQVIPGGRFF